MEYYKYIYIFHVSGFSSYKKWMAVWVHAFESHIRFEDRRKSYFKRLRNNKRFDTILAEGQAL